MGGYSPRSQHPQHAMNPAESQLTLLQETLGWTGKRVSASSMRWVNCRAAVPSHLRNSNAKHARGFPTAACYTLFCIKIILWGVVLS